MKKEDFVNVEIEHLLYLREENGTVANLSKEDLEELKTLDYARLPYANLQGVSARGISVISADFSAAGLEKADFGNSNLTDTNIAFSYAVEANFSNANCKNMVAHDSDLSQCRFWACNLEGADFGGAILIGADFTAANLIGVNFKNAVFDETTNFDFAQMDADCLKKL